MGIAVFFLLALLSAGVIAYPLFRPPIGDGMVAVVSAGTIDRAVGERRRARVNGDLRCPVCDRDYEEADLFCVGCGAKLPIAEEAVTVLACLSCGVSIRESDRFCPQCGAAAPGKEAA